MVETSKTCCCSKRHIRYNVRNIVTKNHIVQKALLGRIMNSPGVHYTPVQETVTRSRGY